MKRDENGRFAPGNEGGPGAPRKGESLTDVLRSKLDKEEVAEKLIAMAMNGDFPALRYIFDRIDGTPRQYLETSNGADMAWLMFFEKLRIDDNTESDGEAEENTAALAGGKTETADS